MLPVGWSWPSCASHLFCLFVHLEWSMLYVIPSCSAGPQSISVWYSLEPLFADQTAHTPFGRRAVVASVDSIFSRKFFGRVMCGLGRGKTPIENNLSTMFTQRCQRGLGPMQRNKRWSRVLISFECCIWCFFVRIASVLTPQHFHPIRQSCTVLTLDTVLA